MPNAQFVQKEKQSKAKRLISSYLYKYIGKEEVGERKERTDMNQTKENKEGL